MPHESQHVKKRTPTDEFEAIERLDRLFEVRLDSTDAPLEPGDFITFEEWDQQQRQYTGRRMSYRVSYAIHTKELASRYGWSEDDIAKRGMNLYGLVPPDYRRMRSVFAHAFVIALVVQKFDSDRQWELVEGPTFLPFLLCPTIDISSLISFSNIDRWPAGIYSVHWMIDLDNPEHVGIAEIKIVDMLVWTWTSYLENEIEEERTQLFLQELDPQALRNGDTINIDGKKLIPAHPDEIGALYGADEEDDDGNVDIEDEGTDDDLAEDDDPWSTARYEAAAGSDERRSQEFIHRLLHGKISDDELEQAMFDKDAGDV